MRNILLLLSLLPCITAFPCINMVDRVPGVSQEHVEFYALGHVELDTDSLNAFIRFRKDQCVERLRTECNDLVIAYFFSKQFSSALELSTRLVARYPKNYSVVITHAAALELNGNIAEATSFMEQAIALNPKSHKGSEWIHVNLLKQRLEGEAGVSPWALIGMDLRPDSALVKPDSVDLKALVKQIHYQVNDRMYFTPEHDPLFGALVFAYADLLHLNGYRNQAKREYERAATYGYTFVRKKSILMEQTAVADSVEQPVLAIEPLAPTASEGNGILTWTFAILIGFALVLGLGLLWRTTRLRR